MIFPEPGNGFHVLGEVYAVSHDVLSCVDALESIRKPGNFRFPVSVQSVSTGEILEAFAYMKSRDLAVPVHSGLLDDYQDRRFIPPWRREAAN